MHGPGLSTIRICRVFPPVWCEFRSRPEIHRGSFLIDTGELDVQQYNSLDTELAWVHGRLSIQSELMWTGLKEASGANSDLYGSLRVSELFSYRRTSALRPAFQHFRPSNSLREFLDGPHPARHKRRPGRLGSGRAMVIPRFFPTKRRTTSGCDNRIELVLESEYPNDVQLDPYFYASTVLSIPAATPKATCLACACK